MRITIQMEEQEPYTGKVFSLSTELSIEQVHLSEFDIARNLILDMEKRIHLEMDEEEG